MANLFDSARLTFERAEHHITDFKTLVGGFINDEPWALVVDKESQPGKHIHKIQFKCEPPKMLPCLLFDATNNLRAVLDQAGYAAAVASGNTRLKATKFPFSSCEDKFRHHVAGACKDLPTEVRSLFEGYKAYKGGDDTLWALNEIANAKKHLALIPLRIGNPTISFTSTIKLGTRDAIWDGKGTVLGTGWDAAKREAELVVCPADVEPQISGHFTFSVTIQNIEVLRSQDSRRVLDAMSHKVRNALLATEAECLRLGFQLDA